MGPLDTDHSVFLVLSAIEKQELLTGLQADRAAYQADEKAATELLSVGSYPLPEKYNAADLAAWTMTANLLLNLDEVVTKN